MKNSALATAPSAPRGLSAEAKRWWKKLAEEYAIEDQAGLFLLETALQAFDRMRESQTALAAEGLTVTDRFGQKKAHPLTVVERDSRAAMVSALRNLNLDLEPMHGARPGRPPGGK